MFEVKNVCKKFGDEYALKNVSMTIGGGLNFIIGASGSGKTTLLKLLTGMDQDFQGEVFYKNKSMKELIKEDKSVYYGHEFGFIWQDFNLVEELTVIENIMMPLYLKDNISSVTVEKLMKQLKISGIAMKKVKSLSGGQKQRVAIARELIKNPDIIIADEPTAALDPKSAAVIMDILKQLSKTKTVIIVTHDTSFIEEGKIVFELDKGQLVNRIQRDKNHEKLSIKPVIKKTSFSFGKALALAKTNIKRSMGRYVAILLTIFISANLLILSAGGGIESDSEKAFDKLYEDYGDTLLDITLVSNFMSAAGADDFDKNKPNANVNQNISGFYDKYLSDERIEYVLMLQTFDNISISVDGKKTKIEGSGNSPVLNKLLCGKMPSSTGNEVVVPESFVKNIGLENEEAIGKEIAFEAEVYNWTTGQPVTKKVNIKALISGVADTNTTYEYAGTVYKVSIDDSFFFGKESIEKMRKQGGLDINGVNLILRAKTPEDVISIKDELNSKGIVPLGYFEIIEDMVRLQSLTKDQSGSAIVLISILAVFVSIAIAVITTVMRKREIAIYKVSGYSNKEISMVTFAEYVIISGITAVVFIGVSPITNKVIKELFNAEILNPSALGLGLLNIVVIALISIGVVVAINNFVKEDKCLKSGER